VIELDNDQPVFNKTVDLDKS